MKVLKWAGLALVAGLAATIVEIAQKQNRYDYVGHCIFDQFDAASQQNYTASARNRQKIAKCVGICAAGKGQEGKYILYHADEIWGDDISPNGMLAAMLNSLGRWWLKTGRGLANS